MKKKNWVGLLIGCLFLLALPVIGIFALYSITCSEVAVRTMQAIHADIDDIVELAQAKNAARIEGCEALLRCWLELGDESISLESFNVALPQILVVFGTVRVAFPPREPENAIDDIVDSLELLSGESFGHDRDTWWRWVDQEKVRAEPDADSGER